MLESLSPALALARLDWSGLLGERAAAWGHGRRGRTTAGGAGRLLRARDGWLAIQLPRPDDWRLVPAWLEIELDAQGQRDEQGWAQLTAAIRTRPVEACVERARLIGLACAPAPRAPVRDATFFRFDAADAPDANVGRERGRPLRVLDLSTLWAGPLATSLLACAGASVLKVESPIRPDGARAGPDAFFDRMNARKCGAALDLTHAGDRARFSELLEETDVVVESARPRALRQLGFSAEQWIAGRAGRLWLSITGYSRAHEWIAFGDDAAIAAGLGWSSGTDPDAPCFCGDALADPLTGLHAAAIALAFTSHGRGGLVDVALRDVTACAAGQAIDARAVEVARAGDGYVVRDAGETATVASPRLRETTGTAPALAPLTEETRKAWRNGAC
ncbi:MAG: CoA transferase [Myxococcota bacterium]